MTKIRVGFIGAGGIGEIHLQAVTKDEQAQIVSICDISLEQAQKQAKHYHASSYTDYEEMLEKEELDAVFLCVPPFVHHEMEEKIVARGIHLLVEKPVELNIARAMRKRDHIHQAGVIHASGYCLRYLDIVQKAKEFLQGKKIAMVRGHYLTGFVPTPWYRRLEKSGGQLVEQATHTLDLMTYLGGDIKKLQARMALQVMNHIDHIDIPDVTAVQFTFKNGAIGQMASTFTQSDHRMGVEVLGKDFRLEINGRTLIINEKGKKRTFESRTNMYEEQDRLFIEAVKTKNQQLILSSYDDGVNTLIASLAANKANENDKTVDLNQFRIESVKSS